MREFLFGNLRIQLLSENIVRLEYAKRGKFCNKPTLLCQDRDKFGGEIAYRTYGNYIIFGGYTLAVPDGARSLSGLKLLKDGVAVYTYKKNTDNALPPAQKTPEVFALSDNPRIIIPDGGYKYRGKVISSGFKCEQNVQDIYLLVCGGDCKKLDKLHRELTGGGELLALSSYGKWTDVQLSEVASYVKNNAGNIRLCVDYKDKAALAELKKTCNIARRNGTGVAVRYQRNCDDVFAPAEVKERDAEINAYLKNGATAIDCAGCSPTEKYAVLQTVKNYNKKTAGEAEPPRAQCLDNTDDLQDANGLMPYIYRLAYENYLCGEPVKKQLGREYVKDKRAAKAENEYIVGNDILLSADAETYLPAGKWLAQNSGKIYAGGKAVAESGTFIRLGSLLPKSENAPWTKLNYEFYPCKNADEKGYIYEDDGQTEGYKNGNSRVCEYKAYFDPYINAYKVELSAAKGLYKDFAEREITFVFYTLSGAGNVSKITVNGADIVYEKTAKRENAPAASLNFSFKAALNKDHLIIFYL